MKGGLKRLRETMIKYWEIRLKINKVKYTKWTWKKKN